MRTFLHITWFLIFAVASYFGILHLMKLYPNTGIVVACFSTLIYYIGRDYINYLIDKREIQDGN